MIKKNFKSIKYHVKLTGWVDAYVADFEIEKCETESDIKELLIEDIGCIDCNLADLNFEIIEYCKLRGKP